jgi:hypothetical protein
MLKVAGKAVATQRMERTMHVQVASDAAPRSREMGMKKLLGLTAVLEAGTGLVMELIRRTSHGSVFT